MSKTHSETDNRLHARPAIQDAGVASHPAIATDQSANVYDPPRTTGTGWIGEDTAKQRIFVSSREAARRKTEKIVIDYTDANTGVGLAQGTGGSMSDAHVRFATRRLEKAIVALQRKRMMPTFTYAKEA